MDFKDLYNAALSVAVPKELSDCAQAASVGAAILTASGNVYTGVCIDTACSMGFCAEHAAAAAMITAGESRILKIVAVGYKGNIIPPCGRCREFLSQICFENSEARVLVNENTVVKLCELLPWDWRKI